MARRLRLYWHPIHGRIGKAADSDVQETARSTERFIKYVPRNVSPISHVIIPQTSGLDPNAHLTPLKGYQIRFKGKILEKTLRSNIFKFRTGHVRRSDYRSHHYEEGYSVHGPYGTVGIRVYYEYELEPYFGSNEVYSEDKDHKLNPNVDKVNKEDKDPFQYTLADKRNLDWYDERENEQTQRFLTESEDNL